MLIIMLTGCYGRSQGVGSQAVSGIEPDQGWTRPVSRILLPERRFLDVERTLRVTQRGKIGEHWKLRLFNSLWLRWLK